MRTYTILSLLLLLSEGLPVVVFAENLTVTVGEDFTEECWFYTPGSKKIFCKNDCNKEEDILVNTTKDRAENGRYSIQYEEETNIMSVRIEKVQMSDSGQYQCKLETILSNIWWVKDVSDEFKIQVTEDFSDLYVINGTTIRPEHESQSPAPHDSPPSEVPVNSESAEGLEGGREYEEVPEQQVQSSPDFYSLALAPAQAESVDCIYQNTEPGLY
ncbi:CMRF35-like molecule 2 isoform X2 [Boleophthalmus pectinirostris]|uniref:CMRF35-like molecule 2 isoform X2 n=1 Tax=Boleophthalmus pectinirostris TaxID=150288 RepID=UPI00242D5AD7|nr:CMRF35-like molecule 2 isoform X2 [Boleophthalmus pectinirostris]XP_055022239.1 CMRF35-like molecule 2 isoform X2 [Boleophthalmus pectinirostris]